MKNKLFHNTNIVCVASIVTARCLHKHCVMRRKQRRNEVRHEKILYFHAGGYNGIYDKCIWEKR